MNVGTLATLWASRVLPAGAKGLWEKHRYLDQGADGCFMSAKDMAMLLGGKAETVETYRQRLEDLGLLRKGEARGMRRHWFIAFPTEEVQPPIILKGHKVPVMVIANAAARLDAYLAERGGWPNSRTGVRKLNPPNPDGSPDFFERNGPASDDESRTGVRVGGSGGSSIEERVKPSHLSGISTDRETFQDERNTDRRSGRGGFEKLGTVAASLLDSVAPPAPTMVARATRETA